MFTLTVETAVNISVPIQLEGLGNVIRLARMQLRLTQQQLAERSGVTGSRISELENEVEGKNSTPMETLQRILQTLDAEKREQDRYNN